MSRARTVERRKEREQQRRRQRQTAVLIGVVAIAVLGIVFLLFINQPAEAVIPAESAARYADLEKSTTSEGFPVLGSDNAPVKVVEYSSFDCTACQRFHETAIPSIVERVRTGEVQLTYVPMNGTGSVANGLGAARAAVCAGEQGKFWEYHDALFSWQAAYVNTAFSQNRLVTGIANLGLDRAKWDACMASPLPGQVTTAAMENSILQNVQGTPTIFVNGQMVPQPELNAVMTAINDAIAAAGSVPPEPVVPEATLEATVEATGEATSEPVAEPTADATAEATDAP